MFSQDTNPRVLLLGGTAEASRMALALSAARIAGVFSYAGRTVAPLAQPMQTRIGGFGGVAGLVSYLRNEAITHVIDATHPFAAQMSRHAVAASAETGLPLLALERPPWTAEAGDDWQSVPDQTAALAALPKAPARIFLAIGKQSLPMFAARPEHHYLLRLVDPPAAPMRLPSADIVLARGPFTLAGDIALLRQHRIELIIAKNAGGDGARAKLDAARVLRLKVLMIERPALCARRVVTAVEDVLGWLAHCDRLGV